MSRVGRVGLFLPVLAVVAVPFAGGVNPPQVAFKELPGSHYGIVRLDQTGGNAVELTRGQPRLPYRAGLDIDLHASREEHPCPLRAHRHA